METNLETLPIGEDAPRLVNAVIEVPVGSRNKYEYEPDLGVIMRDRVLPGAVRYPTDYGFVPSTLIDRGDALDMPLFTKGVEALRSPSAFARVLTQELSPRRRRGK
jgi:inorganic pyrophosphatase